MKSQRRSKGANQIPKTHRRGKNANPQCKRNNKARDRIQHMKTASAKPRCEPKIESHNVPHTQQAKTTIKKKRNGEATDRTHHLKIAAAKPTCNPNTDYTTRDYNIQTQGRGNDTNPRPTHTTRTHNLNRQWRGQNPNKFQSVIWHSPARSKIIIISKINVCFQSSGLAQYHHLKSGASPLAKTLWFLVDSLQL